ncbi:MAG: hypothetical protein JSS61_05205 [Verrucomicrobia bacterium]|nr:hypothetical protein [Verrucomicrobiota bacterium]
MTIFLPSDPALFRQAFDASCDRILGCDQDATFYILFTQLALHLREHPLFKDYLLGLEAESAKRKEEFSTAALEALEENWNALWKYHRHSFKHRKELVGIKRMVTAPREISYSPLYHRVLFRLFEFRYFSPVCRFMEMAPRLFLSAQSALRFAYLQFEHFYPSEKNYFAERKAAPLKLSKRDKLRNLHKKMFDPGANKAPFKRSAEPLHPVYFYLKTVQIKKSFFTPGQNDQGKRRNMQSVAETDPTFCWERIRFLQECHIFNEAIPAFTPLAGWWASIREDAWESAQKKCELETLLGAKVALMRKLSPQPCSAIDSFLLCEHQIHRRDYEKYLQSLKNHICDQLFKIENSLQITSKNPGAELPGTQKEWFVIDLATQFWKANPLGKRDDAYGYYLLKCHSKRLLSRHRWEQIVRERKLDPRPPSVKKRGPGKKTCQN